jgi:hypothetical protein
MCLVIDACCLSMVFDGGNKKHSKFVPVLNWINGKGRMVYGGSKYATELKNAPKFLPYVVELSKRRHTVQIPDATVDLIAADLKRRCPDPKFNDEHIVALVIASRCCVVCTDDNVAISYLKRPELFAGQGVSRPSIYRGHKNHKKLCCDKHVIGLCGGQV